jgi:hypothetical protein
MAASFVTSFKGEKRLHQSRVGALSVAREGDPLRCGKKILQFVSKYFS